MAWQTICLDNVFFPNKLIRVEKNPLPSTARSLFSAVPPFQAQNSLRHAFFVR